MLQGTVVCFAILQTSEQEQQQQLYLQPVAVVLIRKCLACNLHTLQHSTKNSQTTRE